MLCFIALHFIVLHRCSIFFFFFLINWTSVATCLEQVNWHHFSNSVCSLHVPVSHIWSFLQYFKLVHHYYICYDDLWSVTFDARRLWLTEDSDGAAAAAGIRPNDIITYWTIIDGNRVLNTHRILNVYDAGGHLTFETKGDGKSFLTLWSYTKKMLLVFLDSEFRA